MQPALGIGADRRGGVGHPLPDREVGHARADRLDHAGALEARREGQRGRRVQPGAEVDVDEVQSDSRLPYAHLARAGRADLDLLIAHHLGPADLDAP